MRNMAKEKAVTRKIGILLRFQFLAFEREVNTAVQAKLGNLSLNFRYFFIG